MLLPSMLKDIYVLVKGVNSTTRGQLHSYLEVIHLYPSITCPWTLDSLYAIMLPEHNMTTEWCCCLKSHQGCCKTARHSCRFSGRVFREPATVLTVFWKVTLTMRNLLLFIEALAQQHAVTLLFWGFCFCFFVFCQLAHSYFPLCGPVD